MKNQVVYLTGFMASGKSTIGPILANTIGWDFKDIDREIEANCQMKVTEIFQSEGEEYFRSIERQVLKDLSERKEIIIALGGGTIADDENIKVIKNSGLLIYLKSSPSMAYLRLRYKRDRPALLFEGDDEPSRDEFIERINLLLNKRKKYYEQSDFTIDTDNLAVGRTVDKLAKYILHEGIG